MKNTCSLCGGKLKDGICTECGMDNRKSDEMYRNCLNRSKYDHTSMGTMSHVHTEEGAENYKQPVLNENRNKSTGKSKGENPRKNSAADWKTMAGTALPKKQERRGGYKSTDLKNIKGFSSASVQKKNQPSKLIALAILIAVVILVAAIIIIINIPKNKAKKNPVRFYKNNFFMLKDKVNNIYVYAYEHKKK